LNWVGDMLGRFVGGITGGVLGAVLVPIILCIIVSIWLIKLYFGLLKNYVTLIFKIIIAPLEIGAGAFPNAKIGFSSWLLDVVANMAVFPIVGIFLVLLNMIIDAASVSNVGSTGGLFQPAVWAPSLLSAGGISPSIIGAAIGLAGLALVSKLPEMVPQFIFMIKPSPWGQAIGQGLEGAVKDVQKSAPYQAGETYVKAKAGNWSAKQLGKVTSKFAPNSDIDEFAQGLQQNTKGSTASEEAAKKIMG
jgi:hypothetical protein